MKIKYYFSLFLCLWFISCSTTTNAEQNKVSKRPSPGTLKGTLYTNEDLGISFLFPEDWNLQGEEELNHIKEVGADTLSGDDQNMKEAIKSTAASTTIFSLASFKYPLGTPQKLNPSVMLMAEDNSMYPGIKNSDDYILNVKSLLAQSAMDVSVEDIDPVIFSDVTFKGIKTIIQLGQVDVYQQYYVTMIDRNVVAMIMTYFDDDTYQETFGILSGIEIK
ncbi:hypothetical protein [Spirochaeta cellobiosiphila]|uniref:hypothetical protein n=1 Tax=Spirochaeta cellobiosiphila TaxID=504483 RepID=UPI00041290C7|nr:hypothetical protein [Spirochaeta cellobiosiphila]